MKTFLERLDLKRENVMTLSPSLFIVHFAKEAVFAVVAALYNVLGNSGNGKSGFTRHFYLLVRLA